MSGFRPPAARMRSLCSASGGRRGETSVTACREWICVDPSGNYLSLRARVDAKCVFVCCGQVRTERYDGGEAAEGLQDDERAGRVEHGHQVTQTALSDQLVARGLLLDGVCAACVSARRNDIDGWRKPTCGIGAAGGQHSDGLLLQVLVSVLQQIEQLLRLHLQDGVSSSGPRCERRGLDVRS